MGETTAVQTGFYKQVEGPAWLLEGEIRPADKTSLIGAGFVPRIQVKLTPEQSYTAYHWYEAGSPLKQILEGSRSGENEDEPKQSIDPVLERAVEIVTALQILH